MQNEKPIFYDDMKAAQLAGGGQAGTKKRYVYVGTDGKVYQGTDGTVYVSRKKGVAQNG